MILFSPGTGITEWRVSCSSYPAHMPPPNTAPGLLFAGWPMSPPLQDSALSGGGFLISQDASEVTPPPGRLPPLDDYEACLFH